MGTTELVGYPIKQGKMALVWENVSWGDNHLRAKKKKKTTEE